MTQPLVDSRPPLGGPVRVWVPGHARTKGSLSAQVARGVTSTGRRRVRMVESVIGSSEWRATVVRHVMAALGGAPSLTGPRLPYAPWTCAVEVRMCVWLPRPRTVRTTLPVGQKTGDLDKLERNIGDALVDVGVLEDDSLIVSWRAAKLWAPDGGTPGVLIEVTPYVSADAPDWAVQAGQE